MELFCGFFAGWFCVLVVWWCGGLCMVFLVFCYRQFWGLSVIVGWQQHLFISFLGDSC